MPDYNSDDWTEIPDEKKIEPDDILKAMADAEYIEPDESQMVNARLALYEKQVKAVASYVKILDQLKGILDEMDNLDKSDVLDIGLEKAIVAEAVLLIQETAKTIIQPIENDKL
jgi:hypothetical protein